MYLPTLENTSQKWITITIDEDSTILKYPETSADCDNIKNNL